MRRRVMALGLAFATFAGATAAPAQGASGQAAAVARQYYAAHTSNCDASLVSQFAYSARSGAILVELRQAKFQYQAIALNEADRLNGVEAEGQAWLQPSAVRTTEALGSESWSPWQSGARVFSIHLTKKRGLDWQILPLSARSYLLFTGDFSKYPCDNVPGHPARLAREQSERERQRVLAEARVAEQAIRERAERTRAGRALPGEWTAPGAFQVRPSTLTIAREGDRFSAVELTPLENSRREMSGQLLPNGVLFLATTSLKRIDQERDMSGEHTKVFRLRVSADGSSMEELGGGRLYSRSSPSPRAPSDSGASAGHSAARADDFAGIAGKYARDDAPEYYLDLKRDGTGIYGSPRVQRGSVPRHVVQLTGTFVVRGDSVVFTATTANFQLQLQRTGNTLVNRMPQEVYRRSEPESESITAPTNPASVPADGLAAVAGRYVIVEEPGLLLELNSDGTLVNSYPVLHRNSPSILRREVGTYTVRGDTVTLIIDGKIYTVLRRVGTTLVAPNGKILKRSSDPQGKAP